MLDHISFGVSDVARSAAFYDAVLAPLGFVRVWSDATAVGYGLPNRDDCFAIKSEPRNSVASSLRTHLAFAAATRETVAAFHTAALAHGGIDEGAPGLCPEYGAGYYAAFARDPDGYRIEAVLHESSL